MNLFRSEEHARNWSGFKAGTDEGIVKLPDVVALFSLSFFSKRLDPDYASRISEYLDELVRTLRGMSAFWQPAQK